MVQGIVIVSGRISTSIFEIPMIVAGRKWDVLVFTHPYQLCLTSRGFGSWLLFVFLACYIVISSTGINVLDHRKSGKRNRKRKIYSGI
jgi:hypothetical protein